MRLIDIDAIKMWHCPHSVKELCDWLFSLPEVDLESRKKGKWIKLLTPTGYEINACSVCNGRMEWKFEYCPHCGAKMEDEYGESSKA